ncbi:MAG: hypothetical protein QOI64_680 [Solirubrobacteraceae bacterium]|nr:hypothetical protein [Solirubrobacteraceae bacterium]
MTIRLARAESPLVSIVMVTYGAWELTQTALSAVADHTDEPYEVVVVDNASPDDTATRLAEIDGAHVIMNSDNRGFGDATNQGAAAARGRNLVFLNSDAYVHPGWLAPLLETLAGDDSAAAVVGRLLNVDGTLQQAGALLARDGTVAPYGMGDDPERPSYRFRRRLDFGAAACMLVRRQAWDAAGGFDAIYSPAYFEDVDVCLKWADLGWSVVYDPRSVATHVAFGSGGASAALELYERSRTTFLSRWADRLDGRPATLVDADERTRIAARDFPASGRVLVCDDDPLGPAARVVGDLIAANPRLHVAWWAGAPPSDAWLDRGVELVDERGAGWLHDRRYHYDAVVAGAIASDDVTRAIDATQPQAVRATVAELDGPGDMATTLARWGIAPPA